MEKSAKVLKDASVRITTGFAGKFVVLAVLTVSIQGAIGETTDDAGLIASVKSHAADVKRRCQKKIPALAPEVALTAPVTNLPPDCVDPTVAGTPTNDVPITYVLTGIISVTATDRIMALLNNRLVAEGDTVCGNQRVLKIGSDHVVLINTEGTQQVVRISGITP